MQLILLQKQPRPQLLWVVMLGFCLSFSAWSQTIPGLSLSWDKEVGCQVNVPDKEKDNQISIEEIQPETCVLVCEKSVVTYTLSGNLGNNPSVQWNVDGGTKANPTISATAATVQVTWQNAGSGSISFVLNPGTDAQVVKTLCITIIKKPKANFNVIPLITGNEVKEIFACTNQVITFKDLSTTNGGTNINYYLWNFGDGSPFSTTQNPQHLYSLPGDYEVKLTVTNACGCSASYSLKSHIIDANGFTINCPSIVCEGQSDTYNLPFDGKEVCNKYSYTTIGGTITNDPNTTNGSVTVAWDHVDASGFGYLTFSPYDYCNALDCLVPTTIKIPVIKSIGTIQGNTTVCLGQQEIYKLPQWPTTDFQWEILNNPDGDLATVLLTDQCNEVSITPLVEGTIVLKATYFNTLLHCGGTATFIINVVAPIDITDGSVFCQNDTATFATLTGDVTNWKLKNEMGIVINTLLNSETYTYTFVTPGKYILIYGSGNCKKQQREITITPSPNLPLTSSLVGTVAVCPDIVYSYSLPADPAVQYHWTIQNGEFIGGTTGNSVSVKFFAGFPPSLLVYSQSLAAPYCASASVLFNQIHMKTIEAELKPANTNPVCANSLATYKLFLPGTNTLFTTTNSDNISWSISVANAGTIKAGQGTNNVAILWNNVATPTPVTVNATITRCTLTLTLHYTLTVLPIPTIAVTADQNPVCSGTPITFQVVSTMTGVPLANSNTVNWSFDGVPDTTGLSTLDIQYAFTNISTGTTSVTHTATATVINPNGCVGKTNAATVAVAIMPAPPASASLLTQSNSFCLASQIDAQLGVATTNSNNTIQWNHSGLPLAGEVNSTLDVQPSVGFGAYTFTATNQLNCNNTSNPIFIIQHCSGDQACVYTDPHTITNNSTASCGTITFSGLAEGSPVSTKWDVLGPESYVNLTTPTINVVKAGVYHTILTGNYLNTNGDTCAYNKIKEVLVPYVPDLAIATVCQGNSTFLLTFTDQTDFFSGLDNPTAVFSYRALGSTGAFTVITGNTLSLAAGDFEFKVTATGSYDGTPQTACEKTTTLSLVPVPDQSITFSPNPVDCFDRAVNFSTSGYNPINSYLWNFEPGVSNTLGEPSRVFNASGVNTVTVRITNNLGCWRDLSTQVTIPPKFFTGDLLTPIPAVACQGTTVIIQYQAQTGDVLPTSYTWFNENGAVTPANNSNSLNVTQNGAYSVKVSNGSCTYVAPTVVGPSFMPLPTLQLSGASEICEGTPATITALTNANTIEWTLDGNPLVGFSNQTVVGLNNLTPGNHTITATVQSTNLVICTTTASFQFEVVQKPVIFYITSNVFCVGDDPINPSYHVILNAFPFSPGTYNWSNGMNGNSITVLDGGAYQVTLSLGGCTTTKQIQVPDNLEDYAWIFPSGCYEICGPKIENSPVLIGPRLPVKVWDWTYNATIQATGTNSIPDPFTLTDEGSYGMVLQNSNCTYKSPPLSFSYKQCNPCELNPPQIEKIDIALLPYCAFTADVYFFSAPGTTLTLTAPNNNLVISPTTVTVPPGGGFQQLTIVPISPFAGGGNVEIIAQGLDNKAQTCVYKFNFDVPTCDGGIISIFGKKDTAPQLVLAPNPAKEQVSLHYNALPEQTQLAIYDLTGRRLANYTAPNTEGIWQLPTNNMPAGVYIVVVQSNGTTLLQQKLIIE